MTETFAGQERRKYPRLEEKMPLVYQTFDILEGKTSSTKNISGGGLCFETEIAVCQGDVLWIQIHKAIDSGLTRRAPIYAIAKVCWVSEIGTERYESGLEFIDIKDRDRDEIASHVEGKLKQ